MLKKLTNYEYRNLDEKLHRFWSDDSLLDILSEHGTDFSTLMIFTIQIT